MAGPSLRIRLALACTAVAAVVAGAGLILFGALLHRGVAASVDTVLASRSAQAVQAFRQHGLLAVGYLSTPGVPEPGSRESRSAPDAMTVVYRPSGALAAASPAGAGGGLLRSEQLVDARRRVLHLTVTSDGDEPLRVMAVPVTATGGAWVVAVATSLVPATAAADRAVHDLYFGVVALIALVAVGAWLLAGAALRPVERMRAEAQSLTEDGSSSGVISVPRTSDELARLGRTFNDLLLRLRRSVERQRELVADASHELRTPLTVLRTELELADSPGSSRAELADSIHHARREVERLSKLAEDILFLARADSNAPLVQLEPVDISDVLTDAARASRARAETLDVTLEAESAEPLIVDGDPSVLRRALDNLVTNALAAAGPGGLIRMTAQRRGDRAEVAVADDGPGFPPGFVDRAFDRFSRPETARQSERGGAGLGLAIVAEIARALGGTVHAGSGPEGGARVSIELPLAGRPDAARPVRGGGGTG